jgi:glycosyltransferase involved in cell wall biosynthesis
MHKILIIIDTLPNIYHGGGGITAYSVINSLISEGHKVDLLALNPNIHNYENRSDSDYEKELYKIGVHNIKILNIIVDKKINIYRKFFPRVKDLFTSFYKSSEIKEFLHLGSYDGLFAYHWDAIVSIQQITNIPKLGIVGDPIHLPYLYRKEYYKRVNISKFNILFVKQWLLEKTQISRKIKIMNMLLKSCNVSGAFAAHHAFDFQNSGVDNCKYFRTPVYDPLTSLNKNPKSNSKFKILHIGHLQGIATVTGVEILAKEVIPNLDKLIGEDNYELHLVGGHFDTLPILLKQLLTKNNIKIRGQVSPSDQEFLSSNILLVPTPIELGIRVRIITGLSYGNCIISHIANSKGIPELVNNQNCILSNDGVALAKACFDVYKNENKRIDLAINARKTYEKYFSVETAGKEISNCLLTIIKNKT